MKNLLGKLGLAAVGTALSLGAWFAGAAQAGPEHAFLGPWGGGSFIYSAGGENLLIDMSAANRPEASGYLTSPTTAVVTFPDDDTFEATLVSPIQIDWSNGTTWTRELSFDGQWGDAYIAVNGDQIIIDMSAAGRPNASGVLLSPFEAEITFPDDDTFVAILMNPGRIEWSNDTVWER